MRDNRLWQAALRRPFEAGSALVAVLLSAERERWPLWLPVGAGLGIALYFLIPSEPPLWLGPLAATGALVGGILAWRRPSGFLLVLALGMVGVGFAVAQLRTAQVAAPILERRLGPVEVSGQITDLDPRPQGLRMVMEQVQIAGLDADRTPARVRVRLGAAAAEGLHPGQWVSLRAVLMPPPGPVAPGAFDFQRYLYFKQLGAVGYAVVSAVRPVARDDAEDGGSWRMWLSSLRQTVFSRVVAGIDGAPGAIAAALMTGERGAIPKDVLQAVRDSGLAHLLAISGLHIGLFAGILFLGTRAGLALIEPVARRFPIKKWAAVVAAAGAFPYLLITGATVPTQRAFLMTGLVLLAILVDRTAISMRLVAWAAVIILVMTPESLLGASFQMSFAAVIALIAAYEVLRERLVTWRAAGGWWRRPGIYLAGIALTTLIAGFATAPFVLYHFNRFAGYGLVANLVAVPLTALWIMPWAMVAFFLMTLGLEGLALAPMGWGIEGVIWVARTVAGWPGAVIRLPAMPVFGLALVALGGLWLCLWRRRWRLWGLVAVAAGLMTIPLARPPDVLVTGDGKLLAVRSATGELMLSSRRVARFSAERWLERAGQWTWPLWPEAGYSEDGRLACDSMGCIYRAHDQTVALIQDPRALAEDCRTASVVVSTVPVRVPCPSARTVIDRFDLWRRGGHALWLDAERVTVESVADWRGARPWVPNREPGRRSADR